MEKVEHQVQQLEQSQALQENDGMDEDLEPVQHVHLKTAIVGGYFAQAFHVVGAGFLANSVTAVVGDQGKGTWLASTMTISAATLGPPVSQAADYWGRKRFVVVLSSSACIVCVVVSRADSISMTIAGQVMGSLAQGAQLVIHAIALTVGYKNIFPVPVTFANLS